ncbi:MAG: hypothetical protein WDW36_003496 [Sanguina aurantia]
MASKRKASDGSPEEKEKKEKPPSKKELAAALAAGAFSAAGTAGPSASAVLSAGALVNPSRVRNLNKKAIGQGPVIYWMSRDQRMKDNWALLYALEQAAAKGVAVAVAFNLVPAFMGAGARHFGFMLRGLRELEPKLAAAGIPFFMLKGDPAVTIPQLVKDTGAGLLVTDYSPLRLGRTWRSEVCDAIGGVAFREVDAHNVVPVWVASDKREVGARTLRPKIHRHLPEYLKEFPAAPVPAAWAPLAQPPLVPWDDLIAEVLLKGAAVPEITWIKPGEDAGLVALTDPTVGFLSPKRLGLYDSQRNNPGAIGALSGLSAYLHYGQLAGQRAALEAAKHRNKHKAAVESYLEELVVRRELSDNFCEFTPNYDSLDCAAQWARDSLELHRADKREHLYTQAELEAGKTHDELWNAGQLEMVHVGKMHGFMRMYWAKKILEWTPCAADAIRIGIYLNDRYEIDGRDPSGYVGVMWSMCGIHDMGWAERPIFGKIRYMNYAGCKRKFDIPGYCAYVNRRVSEVKAANKAKAAAAGGASGSAPGTPGTSVLAKAAATVAAVAGAGVAAAAAAAATAVGASK